MVKEQEMENEIPDHLSSEYPEFLEYLPKRFDNLEQENYVKNLIETFNINYHYKKFESAFFNLHILYMIIIYSYIIKIKNQDMNKFYLCLINLDKNEVKKFRKKFPDGKVGLFDFNIFKENNVFKFFECLNLTDQEVRDLDESVTKRNIYAHPRGRIIVNDSGKLDAIIESNISAIKILHGKMKEIILHLFLGFIKDNFSDIEGDVEEIERFTLEKQSEINEHNALQAQNQIDYIKKSVIDKFENSLFFSNYFNEKDIKTLVLMINDLSEKYEAYKKIFEFFKNQYSEK
jgi:hypothetical protein